MSRPPSGLVSSGRVRGRGAAPPPRRRTSVQRDRLAFARLTCPETCAQTSRGARRVPTDGSRDGDFLHSQCGHLPQPKRNLAQTSVPDNRGRYSTLSIREPAPRVPRDRRPRRAVDPKVPEVLPPRRERSPRGSRRDPQCVRDSQNTSRARDERPCTRGPWVGRGQSEPSPIVSPPSGVGGEGGSATPTSRVLSKMSLTAHLLHAETKHNNTARGTWR